MAAVTKTVSITEEQEKWLEEHHVSLSSLLQSAIDKEMKKAQEGII